MAISIPPTINYDELIVEDADSFRISGRLYHDPVIFEQEMDKIFTCGWVFVGHTTEVPEPGDYVTRWIGRQPIIMARAEDGNVNLLLNRCRHRGLTVCQEDGGNSSFFRCSYHGWVYSNKGELTGVPFPSGYEKGLDTKSLGLTPVAKVAVHRGFIFASLNPHGQSFDEYIGKAKAYLDRFCDMAPEGEVMANVGRLSARSNANWKFQLENLTDQYHVQITHATGLALRQRAGDKVTNVTFDWENPLQAQRDLGGGHTVLDRFAVNRSVPSDVVNDNMTGATGTLDPEVKEALIRRFGPERAEWIVHSGPPHIMVFPNLMLLWNAFRIIQPISVEETHYYYYPLMFKGASEEINARRLRQTLMEFGPAGFIAPDDMENFRRAQTGTQATVDEWSILNRGLGSEKMVEDEFQQQTLTSQIMNETTQRGIWRHYKQVMMQP
ncbi:MAG TPA: Rieske 2Fe-2S domain-containing protein [Dehalococcoidia bacterium]|nr:Rieske 2Fe-2S domain-containing protein [Dehalococcoidia bacterium]